jgi:two-component system, NtrC family, sensor kinase
MIPSSAQGSGDADPAPATGSAPGSSSDERGLSHVLLAQLLTDSPDRIYFKDLQSRFIAVSAAKANRHGLTPSEVVGKTDHDLFGTEHAEAALRDEKTVLETGVPIVNRLEKETLQDGRVCWAMTTKLPLRNIAGQIIGTYGVSRDVTEMIEAQRTLEQTSAQLTEATRQAGMAEVATGVLHNVGNVLTSINVTANLLVDRLRDSKVTSLFKVCSLLKENAGNLGQFFTSDPRAAKLTSYLENLAANLEKDRQESMTELATLLKSVSHVKDIIWMQQSYASVSGIVEPLAAPETIEDALKLSNNALMRHNVHVVREFTPCKPVRAERHKVLQILVNLISNAKKAMDCKEPSQRRLTIRIEPGPQDTVMIRVSDNGIGIPAENLTKIFSHGFTTRKDGHGFGLHSSALAAKQMGGTLEAYSDGPGKGASFTLLLPAWAEPLPTGGSVSLDILDASLPRSAL